MFNDSNPLLDAALEYAKRGWFVFPLVPGDKMPLGALAPNGFKDATIDPETIRSWWQREPRANIGIATGQSSLVVVDVDAKPRKTGDDAQGWESWRDILASLGHAIDETVRVDTPSGGAHIYYKGNGTPLRNTAGKLGDGLDTRAVGGYVVAPPSIHPNGDPYEWVAGYAPDERELLPLPDGIKQMLLSRRIPEGSSKSADSAIPAGRRNTTLASLAGSMRRKAFSEEAIYQALLVENGRCDPPLPDDEVRKISRSVSSYSPDSGESASDYGNALRLIKLHGEDIHYCERLGGWFIWAGTRWVLDTEGQIERFAKDVPASLYADAAQADGDERKAIAKRALRAESASAKKGLLDMAWSEPGIPVPPEAFDADPWLFNCLNGTVDLRTGLLHEHDREDLVTKVAPVFYDPNAVLPLWDNFLATTTKDNLELIRFLQLCVGYSLTGSTCEEKLFFVHGPAATGKSTFMEAIKAVMGEYARTASFDSFLRQDRTGAPRDDIAGLAGARLVASIEVEKGKKLADGLVKQITGGDTVTARFLYHKEFEYRPAFKLWLVANDAPQATDSDTGLWRRILRVPFEHEIPEADRDPQVKATLTNIELAGPAILAWAVRGCLEWQRIGLAIPQVVRKATEAYRDDNDPLREFYTECCIFDPQAQVTRAMIWDNYQQWARENGERNPINAKELADRLRSKGCKDHKSVGKRYWKGVGLVSDVPEDRF